VDTKLFRRNSW